jgi:hypothetical protein
MLVNQFDYFNNPSINSAIGVHMRHIKNREDQADCRQEIYANLYDFMPLDTDEAITLIDRVAMKFRRNSINKHSGQYEYEDWDAVPGGYKRKAHMSPAD